MRNLHAIFIYESQTTQRLDVTDPFMMLLQVRRLFDDDACGYIQVRDDATPLESLSLRGSRWGGVGDGQIVDWMLLVMKELER